MTDRPLEKDSVHLILAGILRELTGGMCAPGKICSDCDCDADQATFTREREIAEILLRQGLLIFRNAGTRGR